MRYNLDKLKARSRRVSKWEKHRIIIEEMLADDVSVADIAKRFSVSRIHAYRILATLNLTTPAQRVLREGVSDV